MNVQKYERTFVCELMPTRMVISVKAEIQWNAELLRPNIYTLT